MLENLKDAEILLTNEEFKCIWKFKSEYEKLLESNSIKRCTGLFLTFHQFADISIIIIDLSVLVYYYTIISVCKSSVCNCS